MFTGIIRATSTIVGIEEKEGNRVYQLLAPPEWSLSLGQSICIDGVCSTVISCADGVFEVLHMPQTLSCTTSSSYVVGSLVNLEQSLTLQDFVDGHLVSGHVDAVTTLVALLREEDGSVKMTFQIPKELDSFIVAKGSICLNGVSLTVAMRDHDTFTVALIPYTLSHTNLGVLQEGAEVNIEVDLVARYILSNRT